MGGLKRVKEVKSSQVISHMLLSVKYKVKPNPQSSLCCFPSQSPGLPFNVITALKTFPVKTHVECKSKNTNAKISPAFPGKL